MRIAIWENLPPGGAKRAAFELGRALAGRHEVDLYRLNVTNSRAFDLRPVVRNVYDYPYRPAFGLFDARLAQGRLAPRSLTIFGPLRRLHRRIAADMRQRDYDIVLAHTDGMTQSPYLLRWLEPRPSVYFCQEIFRVAQERWLRDQWRRQQRRVQFPLGPALAVEDGIVRRRLVAEDETNVAAASQLVVNSRYMRERVFSAYGRSATVCYLGVDPERFRPDADTPRDDEVLSIGSPLWIKGHDLVIDALGLLPDRRRPGLRVVAQSARGSDALEKQAGSRGVRLTVETAIDEPALVDRYRRALVTICAARLEPFGLTAIESMACGTAVVALDEGGYRETVVPGETGLLSAPEPQPLAEAIGKLIADPNRALQMGRNGRARVEQCWTWSKSAHRLESILQSLVG